MDYKRFKHKKNKSNETNFMRKIEKKTNYRFKQLEEEEEMDTIKNELTERNKSHT